MPSEPIRGASPLPDAWTRSERVRLPPASNEVKFTQFTIGWQQGAQFVADFIPNSIWSRHAYGVGPADQARAMRTSVLVDAALAPVGPPIVPHSPKSDGDIAEGGAANADVVLRVHSPVVAVGARAGPDHRFRYEK